MRSTKIFRETVYDRSAQTFNEHPALSQQLERPRDHYDMMTVLMFLHTLLQYQADVVFW